MSGDDHGASRGGNKIEQKKIERRATFKIHEMTGCGQMSCRGYRNRCISSLHRYNHLEHQRRRGKNRRAYEGWTVLN